MRRWLAVMLATLSVAGCGTREEVTQAAGDYDEGTACRNASGNCYLSTVRNLCVTMGPAGCDEDPAGLFCCIQFGDLDASSSETTDADASPMTEAGVPMTEGGVVTPLQ